MKKNLINLILVLASAFAFTSCGDSKEAVVDDIISLMEETAKAVESGDESAIEKLNEKGDALKKRAKAVGIDPDDPSTMPDELKKKFEDATKKMIAAAMKKAMEDAGK